MAEAIERSKKRAAVQSAGIDSALVLEGITELITADDIREAFFKFGDIKAIRLYHKDRIAIVWFVEVPSAQNALAELSPEGVGKQLELEIKDANRLKLRWATATDMAELVEEQQRQRAKEEEEHKRREAVEQQSALARAQSSDNSASLPPPPGMTEADVQELSQAHAGFTPAVESLAPQAQAQGQAYAAAGGAGAYPADLAQQWQQYYAYYGMYGQAYPAAPVAAPAPMPAAKKLPPKPKGPPPPHAFRNRAPPQVAAQPK